MPHEAEGMSRELGGMPHSPLFGCRELRGMPHDLQGMSLEKLFGFPEIPFKRSQGSSASWTEEA
jgi:hypothetical protein